MAFEDIHLVLEHGKCLSILQATHISNNEYAFKFEQIKG